MDAHMRVLKAFQEEKWLKVLPGYYARGDGRLSIGHRRYVFFFFNTPSDTFSFVLNNQ